MAGGVADRFSDGEFGADPNSHREFMDITGKRPQRLRKCQTAYKPGSVLVVACRSCQQRGMTIHLGRPLPDASRDRPGQRFGNPLASMFSEVTPALIPTCRPYLVLLPVGFAVPLTLPPARCALTAPFHPYLSTNLWAGGLLSVALSLGSPPPGVTRHRVSVEPGLSSLAAVAHNRSGHPAVWRLKCTH